MLDLLTLMSNVIPTFNTSLLSVHSDESPTILRKLCDLLVAQIENITGSPEFKAFAEKAFEFLIELYWGMRDEDPSE
jgi:hypothetical protein